MRRCAIALVTAVIFTLGCAQSLRFSVVDSATRKPLEGVEVEWLRVTPGFLKEVHLSSNKLSQSRGTGTVEANSVSRKGSHNFIFSKSGYHPARFVFAHGEGYLLSPDSTNVAESTFAPVTNPVVILMNHVGK